MHHTGYVVWIDDEQYWHLTMEGAKARVRAGQLSGKDTFMHSLKTAHHCDITRA